GLLAEKFPSVSIRRPTNTIKSVGGSSTPVGEVDLFVKYNNKGSVNRFVVIDAPGFPIMLGSHMWKALGLGVTGVAHPSTLLSPSVDTPKADDQARLFDADQPQLVPTPARVANALEKNASIAPDVPCSHPMAVVRVDIPAGTKPIYIYPRRRIEQYKNEAVTAQVTEWLNDGVIERCRVASPWNSALVVVPKKDHNGVVTGMRVCIDPRHINDLTPDDQHPLPHIMEYLDDASGAAVMSKLDLRASFHQFEVLEQHRQFLAFTWDNVQYRFRRGPFGLKSLAGQFQRVMSAIFADLP
ncbi:MAG: hypothetical protein AN485_22840, partial [Anabaena sp. MDT14b]